jgi:hypothetical protein
MGKLVTQGLLMVAGVAGLVLTSSSAALADDTVIAKVPFDFIVNGVHMPAGSYQVTQLDGQAIISVKSADNRHFAFVLTNALAPEEAGPSAELVFDRVNSTNFLARVVGAESEGREIPLPANVLKSEPTRVAVLAFPARKSTGH